MTFPDFTNMWQNATDTADESCFCGSWKKHWERYSGRTWPHLCSVSGCTNRAEVGAHVKRPFVNNQVWIIPMCSECNNPYNTSFFTIKQGTNPVPADPKLTCNRRWNYIIQLLKSTPSNSNKTINTDIKFRFLRLHKPGLWQSSRFLYPNPSLPLSTFIRSKINTKSC